MKNKNIQLVSSKKSDQNGHKEPTNVYAFDEFTLDVTKQALFKSGHIIRIEKRMFLLLKLLVSNSPEALKKDELMEQLWENQVVTDWSLSRLISDARKVLGDDGKSQKYIKTVRGEGFRFSGNVHRLNSMGKTIERRQSLRTSQYKNSLDIKKIAILAFLVSLISLFGFKQYNNIQKTEKIQIIEQLAQNLMLTKTSHNAQKKRRNELGKMIENRFQIQERKDWEKFFSEYYAQLNTQELFIFDQIRVISEGPIYKGNKNVLDILQKNPNLKDEFSSYQDLVNHLNFWINKYENVFLQREDMCLVYAGEEDGVPFPSDIDQEVANWLLENKKE